MACTRTNGLAECKPMQRLAKEVAPCLPRRSRVTPGRQTEKIGSATAEAAKKRERHFLPHVTAVPAAGVQQATHTRFGFVLVSQKSAAHARPQLDSQPICQPG